MTSTRTLVLKSLRFLACSGFSTTTRALRPPRPFAFSTSSALRSFASVAPQTLQDESFQLDPDAKKTFLVVGDGDFSYSASVASEMAESGSSLIATVFEKKDHHQEVYRNSRQHTDTISSFESHQVLFETDATQLHKLFPSDSFDTIQFNFPHWLGKKANNRYNRQLLGDFLQSASQVLKQEGEIQVALRSEQGGARAKDLTEWRLSWTASELAANAGLLLSRLDPFEPEYDVSAYRGKDKVFHVGLNPERYVFTFPRLDQPVERDLQLCYRHELRLMMEPECLEASPYLAETLLNDDIILDLAQKVVPEGIRVELPARAEITPRPGKSTSTCPLLVFLMVYSGESVPLRRVDADNIRARLEEIAIEELGFPLAKKGRMVSKPFPYPVLPHLVRNHS